MRNTADKKAVEAESREIVGGVRDLVIVILKFYWYEIQLITHYINIKFEMQVCEVLQ